MDNKNNTTMKGSDNQDPVIPKGMRLWFGIFMVCFYLGMGILFLSNLLQIGNSTTRILVGCLFCIYGVWRGYRLYKDTRYN